ncbi:MAG: hypothetical protein ACTSR8_16435 [Promethearchaeota archaeon]
MTEKHFKIIKAEILQELAVLKKLTEEGKEFYKKNKGNLEQSNNLRVFGSILHDFYTGIEKVFRNIAMTIDEELPSGPSWHSDLLNRMSISIPSIRREVIGDSLKAKLFDYLRFRHIFRNVYGFELNWDKMGSLIINLDIIYQEFETQIHTFLQFLFQIDLDFNES